jgi:toxin ParE1/3/4
VAEFRLSASAETAIDDILARSERSFGEQARERYAALFVAAMTDVADDPNRPGVKRIETSRHQLALYHIGRSREHVVDPSGRVGEPRHLIVFRQAADGVVEILGVIHERMLRGRALRSIVREIARD